MRQLELISFFLIAYVFPPKCKPYSGIDIKRKYSFSFHPVFLMQEFQRPVAPLEQYLFTCEITKRGAGGLVFRLLQDGSLMWECLLCAVISIND